MKYRRKRIHLGGRVGNEYAQLIRASAKLIEGKTVFVLGCKNPKAYMDKLESIMCIRDVIYAPVYNGQGRELGKMTMPKDDKPIGYNFKIIRLS